MNKANQILEDLQMHIELFKDAAPKLKGIHNPSGAMKNWVDNPDSSAAPGYAVIQYDTLGEKIIGWAAVGYYRSRRNIDPMVSVYVVPEYRNKGLGQKLVVTAVEDQVKNGEIDDECYYDPNAPQLANWIEMVRGVDAVPIPMKDLVDD